LFDAIFVAAVLRLTITYSGDKELCVSTSRTNNGGIEVCKYRLKAHTHIHTERQMNDECVLSSLNALQTKADTDVPLNVSAIVAINPLTPTVAIWVQL